MIIAAIVMSFAAGAPQQAPEGDWKIAYRSERGREGGWFMMNEDGTGVEPFDAQAVVDSCPHGHNIYRTYAPARFQAESSAEDTPGDGRTKIFLSRLDRSERRRLTGGDTNDAAPLLSFKEDKVAYLATGRDGTMQLRVVETAADGKENTAFEGMAREFTWSPDGARLAFVLEDREQRADQVWTVNADGTKRKALTEFKAAARPGSARVGKLAYSPDGAWIAFEKSGAGGPGTLAVMKASGGDAKELVPLGIDCHSYAWSPDSRLIALTGPGLIGKNEYGATGQAANQELFLVKIDGSGAKNISNTWSTEDRPQWIKVRKGGGKSGK